MRLPRRTVRLRLTLLYSGLFLLSGAGLLFITYVLVASQGPVVHAKPADGSAGETADSCVWQEGLTEGSIAVRTQLSECADTARSVAAIDQLAETLDQLLTQSGTALAIMTVVSLGLGWLMAGRVLHPLRTITAATQRISARNLHARLGMSGPDDELKELGDTIDGLLARLEASFSAQRQFVANASHELRTPLARQRALVEVALGDPYPTVASLRAACERVLVTGEQQERLIEALLTLARSERGLDRREPVDLRAVTAEVAAACGAEADARGVRLDTDLDAATGLGDARLAERLVTNLVDNAIRHNVPGGRVEVATETIAGQAVLTVTNTGPVIQPGEIDRLFQPFQRLGAGRTATRDGLGLGLPIVVAIAAAHGATLNARALPAGGLAVYVQFPARPPAQPPTVRELVAHVPSAESGRSGAP